MTEPHREVRVDDAWDKYNVCGCISRYVDVSDNSIKSISKFRTLLK